MVAAATDTFGTDFGSGMGDHLMTCGCSACQHQRDDPGRALEPTLGPAAATGRTATLSAMADFLEVGYWNNGSGLRHNLGTTGPDPNNGILHYNVSGFSNLPYSAGADADGVTAARANLIRDAFDLYEMALGIDFVETRSTDHRVVDFFFSDNAQGAYAESVQYNDGTIYYSQVNVAKGWSGGTSGYDDYNLQTILHEIGHALGLGHQGSYNGSADYESGAEFALDSWQATMMSYFSQRANTVIDADYEFLQTPMAVDWLALDSIYGQFGYGVSNAFLGDTTYGFGTTISAEDSRIWNRFSDFADRTASTIVDAGGIDTLDVSGYDADQRIDLTVQSASRTAQTASDIGGRIGNLTLAVGTVIENAIGGSGSDILIGNDADNRLQGGAGDDTLTGLSGDDIFDGGPGFDTVVYESDFDGYAFGLLEAAIEVIGDGVDLVLDTIESVRFSDATYAYDALVDLISRDAAPDAVPDRLRIDEGEDILIDVLANDIASDRAALQITAIDGRSIRPGQTLVLDDGTLVTLTAEGTLDYGQNGAFDDLEDGATGRGGFAYSVTDAKGASDTADVTITIDGISGETGDPPGNTARPIGQSGVASVSQTGASEWHRVSFDVEIENAVVVMGPMTFNGGNPGTVRLRDVTDAGFEFQIDEWDYLDGVHLREDIGWLAISGGTHVLGDGRTVVAGTEVATTRFERVDFGASLGEAVVMADVASVNEADAVTTRIRRVGPDGFEMTLQEQEAGNGHVPETVSWIAIETGISDGLEAVRTGDQLGDRAERFEFAMAFETAPVLLGDLQTTDGGDTTTLRMDDLFANGVSLFAEEEQSRDRERAHTDEVAGYVALNEGLIYDTFLLA